MGKFYPSQFPFDGEPNERTVYQACKDHLGDTDWHCIFGYRYLNRNNPEVVNVTVYSFTPSMDSTSLRLRGKASNHAAANGFAAVSPVRIRGSKIENKFATFGTLFSDTFRPIATSRMREPWRFPGRFIDMISEICHATSHLLNSWTPKILQTLEPKLETLVADTRKRKKGKTE